MHAIWDDITDFIFLQDAPQGADVLFIPGSAYAQPCELAARLYAQGYAPLLLPSGKYAAGQDRFPGQAPGGKRYGGNYACEWEFLRDVLVQNGVAESCILREDQARYTYQNALLSRAVTDRMGLTIRRALLCCQAYHARRSYMYYQYVYPNAQILVCPADTQGVGRGNWMETRQGRQLVLGELERCGAQFRAMLAQPDAP